VKALLSDAIANFVSGVHGRLEVVGGDVTEFLSVGPLLPPLSPLGLYFLVAIRACPKPRAIRIFSEWTTVTDSPEMCRQDMVDSMSATSRSIV